MPVERYGPDDAEILQVRKRGDTEARRRSACRPACDRSVPADRPPAFEPLDEGRGHPAWSRRNMNRRRLQRQPRFCFGHARVDVEQRTRSPSTDTSICSPVVGPPNKHAARVGVQLHAEHILAIGRKRMARREAAAGAEWRALRPLQLRCRLRDPVIRLRRPRVAIADRERGEFAAARSSRSAASAKTSARRRCCRSRR